MLTYIEHVGSRLNSLIKSFILGAVPPFPRKKLYYGVVSDLLFNGVSNHTSLLPFIFKIILHKKINLMQTKNTNNTESS